MDYSMCLQSMILLAIDCVIFNDKLAGTTSVSSRNKLICKYKPYFAQVIYSDYTYSVAIKCVDTVIKMCLKSDSYSKHAFLMYSCRKIWLFDNEFIKIKDF